MEIWLNLYMTRLFWVLIRADDPQRCTLHISRCYSPIKMLPKYCHCWFSRYILDWNVIVNPPALICCFVLGWVHEGSKWTKNTSKVFCFFKNIFSFTTNIFYGIVYCHKSDALIKNTNKKNCQCASKNTQHFTNSFINVKMSTHWWKSSGAKF